MNRWSGFMDLAPEWILLVGGCVTLSMGVWKAGRGSRFVSPFSCVVVLAALLAAFCAGDLADGRAAPGLYLTSLLVYTRYVALGVGLLIILVNANQSAMVERGEYMALILFSLLGILLTAAANDLLVLFFAIELVSVPTYVLIALSRPDHRASEASVKYFFLGALAAAILAYGFSFLYGAAGTTLLRPPLPGAPSVAATLSASTWSGPAWIGVLLVFGGLCFKIAAVPLHLYVPDVYEGAASPISGMLGFVPKIAGFLALLHLFAAMNWNLPEPLFWLVWIVAATTMTAGNVLALLQKNVKRVLACSSIAHSGYMLIALLVGPSLGVGPMRDGAAALLFYIAVYGAMNLGAFAALAATRIGDQEAETFDDLSGLSAHSPAVAAALVVCVFSLMGMPPLVGFVGKLYIFAAAFALSPQHEFHTALIVLAIIGVANTAVGAAYYLRIAAAVYLKSPVEPSRTLHWPALRWGLALCAVPLLVLFVWPGTLSRPAQRAALALRSADPRQTTPTARSIDPPQPVRAARALADRP